METSESAAASRLLALLDEPDPVRAVETWVASRMRDGCRRDEILRILRTIWSEDPMVLDEVIEHVQLGRLDGGRPDRRGVV